MARVLTITRATVAPAQRAAYLATLAALAQRLEARGTHCWVFEEREQPGVFVEFAEGGGPGTPRGASGDPAEAALEAHLESLARYEAPRHVAFDAVALTPPSRS
jgi:hypothetical protein